MAIYIDASGSLSMGIKLMIAESRGFETWVRETSNGNIAVECARIKRAYLNSPATTDARPEDAREIDWFAINASAG